MSSSRRKQEVVDGYIKVKLIKNAEVAKSYERWKELDNGLYLRWLKLFFLELLSLTPLRVNISTAVESWRRFVRRRKLNSPEIYQYLARRGETRVLEDILRDFGVRFTGRESSIPRNTADAFKEYGQNLAAITHSLQMEEMSHLTEDIAEKVDQGLLRTANAVASNLSKELEGVKAELEAAQEFMSACDAQVLESTKEIINSVVGLRDSKLSAAGRDSLLERVRIAAQSISSKCSLDKNLSVIEGLLDDLKENLLAVPDVLPDLVSQLTLEGAREVLAEQQFVAPPPPPLPPAEAPSATPTAGLKGSRRRERTTDQADVVVHAAAQKSSSGLLSDIVRGVSLKSVAERKLKAAKKKAKTIEDVFRAAITRRRKSFEDDDDTANDDDFYATTEDDWYENPLVSSSSASSSISHSILSSRPAAAAARERSPLLLRRSKSSSIGTSLEQEQQQKQLKLPDAQTRCGFCGQKDASYLCAGCSETRYCTEVCQERDWMLHHKDTCCCCSG